MPTPGPWVRIARTAASTSSSRRVRRCASQRVRRPSGAWTVMVRTVPDTFGISPVGIRPRRKDGPAMAPTIRRAAVVGGNRIPFARANGPYRHASNQDMLTAALDGLVARFGLQGETVGEVAAGAVLKHSRDYNLTRESVLGSRLAPSTPAYDVQQACGTGLETTILVANKIALGQIDAGI